MLTPEERIERSQLNGGYYQSAIRVHRLTSKYHWTEQEITSQRAEHLDTVMSAMIADEMVQIRLSDPDTLARLQAEREAADNENQETKGKSLEQIRNEYGLWDYSDEAIKEMIGRP